jgi:hypothetical protein
MSNHPHAQTIQRILPISRTTVVIAAVLAFGAALPAAPAQAQNARSFVSSTGSDSNPCTLAAPCRSFTGAYAQTNAGGEIDVLNTAGYGPLTITHAISIVNDGSTASVLASGVFGVTINAGATDAVSLRGLTFEGAGAASGGIEFNTGQSLTIENCVIRHMTGDGIDFTPNATSSLLVSDTLVADNSGNGIVVQPTGSGTVTAVLNRVEVNNNGANGIEVAGNFSTGTIKATVSESVATGNSHLDQVGFFAVSSTLTVFHSVASNNYTGIEAAGSGGTLTIAQSMVTGNNFGWNAGGGVVQSYGDNYFNGNGSNAGSLTPVSKQ